MTDTACNVPTSCENKMKDDAMLGTTSKFPFWILHHFFFFFFFFFPQLMMMHITHFTVLSALNWQQKYALQKNLLMQELMLMVLNCSKITRENYKILFVVKNDIIILSLQIRSYIVELKRVLKVDLLIHIQNQINEDTIFFMLT